MMNKDNFNEKKSSLDFGIFGYDFDNLDLMNRNIYLDCLYKEHISKEFYRNSNKLNENKNYDNLTLILVHTDTFGNNYENSLEFILNYWLHMGISNIIIASYSSNIVKEYERKFKKLIRIDVDETSYNKSHAINESLKKVKTDYVLICDDNSFISEKNFKKSFLLLDDGYDFVYPHNRSFLKIDSMNDFEEDFDTDSINCKRKEYLNFDYIFLFSRLNSLKKVGGFNPRVSIDKCISDELNMRINLSDFTIKRCEESLYLFGLLDNEIDEYNLTELIKCYNLSKLNDVNILIFQDEEMFYLSREFYTKRDMLYKDGYKVSVVIPVYNCEDFYLDRCIASLENQSIGFENIEVILVDDKSKYKKSRDKLKRYSDMYENVKTYFLKKNQGSGVARNYGISKVSSDYVCFLDYDDFYVKTFCENAYDSLADSDDELFISNYVNLVRKPYYLINWKFLNLKREKKHLKNYEDDLNILKIDPSIWTKCYRRSFLIRENVKFSNYKVAQDNLFNVKSLFKAEGISIRNVPSVIYDTRDNVDEELKSRTLIINKESLITRIKVYEDILDLYANYAPQESLKKINSSLNYWTKNHLLKSQLTKNEFFEVIKEASKLFKMRVNNQSIKIPESFIKLFEYIAYENYDEAYDFYCEYVN